MSSRRIYVGIGGNVGHPSQTFQQTVELLTAAGLVVLRQSPLFRTAPVGPISQPDYLNGIMELQTALPPAQVQTILQATERTLGRDRTKELRWGPRTLDLDYLLDEDAPPQNTDTLTLPHPRMWERAFVLAPLSHLRPDLHAPTGEPITSLANHLSQTQNLTPPLTPTEANNYLAVDNKHP